MTIVCVKGHILYYTNTYNYNFMYRDTVSQFFCKLSENLSKVFCDVSYPNVGVSQLKSFLGNTLY